MKNEFNNLKNPNELMEFMDEHIKYGWVDKVDKLIKLNSLTDVRKNYETMSIEDIFKYAVGTCIEQAKLIKKFFDDRGIPNNLYCERRYENGELEYDNVRMDCFVLFNLNGKWYHFEHSNSLRKGIHEYESISDALKDETSRFKDDDIRIISQIPEIPDGLSFNEFNLYVNSFNEIKLENINNKKM